VCADPADQATAAPRCCACRPTIASEEPEHVPRRPAGAPPRRPAAVPGAPTAHPGRVMTDRTGLAAVPAEWITSDGEPPRPGCYSSPGSPMPYGPPRVFVAAPDWAGCLARSTAIPYRRLRRALAPRWWRRTPLGSMCAPTAQRRPFRRARPRPALGGGGWLGAGSADALALRSAVPRSGCTGRLPQQTATLDALVRTGCRSTCWTGAPGPPRVDPFNPDPGLSVVL